MHEHAQEVVPQSEYCPCGHKDNIDHRVQGCFVWNNEQAGGPGNGEGTQGPQCHADVVDLLRKPTYYICKVDGVEVGFEHFAWALDATVFTDGLALCVGFPVALGGAAAFQVSVGPTGVTTVRSHGCCVARRLQGLFWRRGACGHAFGLHGGKKWSHLVGVGQCGRWDNALA